MRKNEPNLQLLPRNSLSYEMKININVLCTSIKILDSQRDMWHQDYHTIKLELGLLNTQLTK
jgi:hypothetical protein